MTDEIVCSALGAGLFAILVGLNAGHLGRILGLMDFPDPAGGRKRHSHVTPLLGGTAVIIPVVTMLLAVAMGFGGADDFVQYDLAVIGTVTAAFYLLGATDDRVGLSPLFRLGVGVAIICIGILLTPRLTIQALHFTLSPNLRDVMIVPLSYAGGVFTLVCMVGLLNAVNMADGKNGVVIGLSLMWTGCLAFYAPPYLHGPLAVAAVALAVALWFNMRGQFFLGDGGSYGLSVLFGALSIYIYNDPSNSLTADTVATWFIIPVLDCLRLMTMRMLRGRSPFSGDREHFHHHLGYLVGWPNGLLIYWAMAGVPAAATILLPGYNLQILLAVSVAYSMVIAVAYRRLAVTAG